MQSDHITEPEIRQITNPDEKSRLAREILEALPEWFEVEESRERYITESRGEPFFAAFSGGCCTGFLCLKQTGDVTCELAVTGVKKESHRRGIGKALFAAAAEYARASGFRFMQVKTVAMGKYPEYDATNRFYQALGFCEFEMMPLLWDEANPCQIYILAL